MWSPARRAIVGTWHARPSRSSWSSTDRRTARPAAPASRTARPTSSTAGSVSRRRSTRSRERPGAPCRPPAIRPVYLKEETRTFAERIPLTWRRLLLGLALAVSLLAAAPVSHAATKGSCTSADGQALIDQGRYDRAVREFTCLINTDPTGVEGYRGRIEAQVLLGR